MSQHVWIIGPYIRQAEAFYISLQSGEGQESALCADRRSAAHDRVGSKHLMAFADHMMLMPVGLASLGPVLSNIIRSQAFQPVEQPVHH